MSIIVLDSFRNWHRNFVCVLCVFLFLAVVLVSVPPTAKEHKNAAGKVDELRVPVLVVSVPVGEGYGR